MSRPTAERIEEIRANDCGHPECYECGARMQLLAEIDALAARVQQLEAALRRCDELMTAHWSGNAEWGAACGPNTYHASMQQVIRAALASPQRPT